MNEIELSVMTANDDKEKLQKHIDNFKRKVTSDDGNVLNFAWKTGISCRQDFSNHHPSIFKIFKKNLRDWIYNYQKKNNFSKPS